LRLLLLLLLLQKLFPPELLELWEGLVVQAGVME
jgi:hypothetical protein